MPLWLQHLLVIVLVAACVAVVVRQLFRTFTLRKSRLGACCARGCEPATPAQKNPPERVVFLPSETLRKRH